ncbi:DMT family transporter [Halocalculus aciditolerans]|uniref:EamA family transporter n=1 Tax=Halocalculus aciditolerans TaxID=1383812 RepID=A0A830F9D2_9EURY|nr:DMT family transporter [Halocalculus aciditolerans]GGL52564.1 EamA family transporter [Halocalculus aciditolerans]
MAARRTALAFLAASLLFGGTFVAAKYGLQFFPPLLFVSLRFDVAAVALAAYVLLTRPLRSLLPRSRRDLAAIAAAGVFSVGLTNAFLFVGQQYATSAIGAIVFSLNPILTPVFAALLLDDERLSRRTALGMAVGLLGVAVVVNPTPDSLLAGGLGKLLLLGGAASAALGSVLIRRADGDLSSTTRTAWAFPLGALLTHALAAADGQTLDAVTWTHTGLAALAFVGVFAGALAFIAYFTLLDDAGPTHANLIFYVVPLAATAGGALVLDETITPLTVAGFLVVFAGFAIIGSRHLTTALTDFLPTDATQNATPTVRLDDATGHDAD